MGGKTPSTLKKVTASPPVDGIAAAAAQVETEKPQPNDDSLAAEEQSSSHSRADEADSHGSVTEKQQQQQHPSPVDRAPGVPARPEPGSSLSHPTTPNRSWLALMLYRLLKSPSATLSRITQMLASSSGQDKVWMFVQYFTKFLTWAFAVRKRTGVSRRLATLSGLISDYRIMMRMTDLVPMWHYVRYVEQNPSKSQTLHAIDRLQNLLLLCYYPLEHIYWLGAHKIIPISDEASLTSSIWSCRFWAGWVVVQFAHLWVERRILRKRKQACLTRPCKGGANEMEAELDQIEKAERDWYIQLLINAAYLPLTIHWSLRNSKFPEVLVGVFGSVAAAAQAYTKWKSLA
ncbi:hypothetical protein EV182_001155 [Spiromyces aspiralis]|uniref:Uncharacterized protein n=1 Tax=Spiromyces aspiralis TaxID=68401 RepID=A0ACC1HIL9_9FUNG|nr:hypothetical protein EV182_001155 [Spiromyces aspiralis]